MGGNGMQTLLKEKTAKRIALTVYCETVCKDFKKTEGVIPRTCSEMLRFLIQTDCQTFPSFAVHMTHFNPNFGVCKHLAVNCCKKLLSRLGGL
jgi:hypothetical protein